MRHLMIVCLLALMVGTVAASKSGGVIYLHDPDDTMAWSPLLCSTDICEQVQRLVLPSLLAGDFKRIEGYGAGTDTVLALEMGMSEDGRTITLSLRSDLLWEDGTPVTAYDVFYSFLMMSSSQYVRAAIPLDAQTIRFELTEPDCDLNLLQMFILPAHVFDATFAQRAADFGFTDDESVVNQWVKWRETDQQTALTNLNAEVFRNHPYHTTMPITLMGRDMAMVSPGDFLRVLLGTGDDSVGLHIYSNIDTESATDYFLAGQLDVLREVPFLRWPDLAAAPGMKLYRRPTGEKAVLIFNLNDSNKANPYKDQFDNLLPQVPHPILSDLKVRQAIAAAIDVNELITVGLNGFGTPTNETFDANTDLSSPDTPRFDPAEAERLLDEAGWIRGAAGSDQVRRCKGCATAEENYALSLSLLYEPTTAIMPMIGAMQRQLKRVGFGISPQETDVRGALASQFYDLAFFTRNEADEDLLPWFITQNDGAQNVSSYSSPQVDKLLADKDGQFCASLPDVYKTLEDQLAQDLPEITLFAFEDVVAVRDWVLADDSAASLLNIDTWQVYYGPEER